MYKNVTRNFGSGSLRRRLASFGCVALILTAAYSPFASAQSVTQGYGYPASNNGGYPAQYFEGLQNNQQSLGANYGGGQNFQNYQSLQNVPGFEQYADQYGAQPGLANNPTGAGYGDLITTSNPDVPPQYALDENGAIIPFPTEAARASQGNASDDVDDESSDRPASQRLGFGARRAALDIWSEFLFGKRTPNHRRSLFAQPKRPATAPTDKLEPNPLLRLFTFGLFAPKEEEPEPIESDYYGYEPQTFDSYDYQEGVGGNFFDAAPSMTEGYGNFSGYEGFGEQYQPEYQQNAFLPPNNYLGYNAPRAAQPRAKATQSSLSTNETRLASAPKTPQGKANLSTRPTTAQIAQSNVQKKARNAARQENALAANAKGAASRPVASPRPQSAELAQKTRPQNARRVAQAQPRREAPQVAQRQDVERRPQNVPALAQNERAVPRTTSVDDLTDEELAAARKRRLQELNAILAAKRPEENASHIQQASALARAPRQNQLEARAREIKTANAQFRESELERYRNSGIRQVSNIERRPQSSPQTNARPVPAQPLQNAPARVAKPVKVSPPQPAASKSKRTIVPQPVPTYDSSLTEEEESELDYEYEENEEEEEEIDVEEEDEEDAKPAPLNQKPVVKRPTAQFIDPKDCAW